MSARRSKRPRRKAKQDRARETVGVVLEAAARVLARHGYAGATTNRIAEAAGVSVGTVYEYFANKEAVFEALVEREMEELLAALQGDEPPPPDAAIGDVLGRVIVSGMTAMRHGPELYRALERVPGTSFRRRLVEGRHAMIDYVRQLLVEHRSELRVRDLDLAAFVVVSAAEGIAANASRDQFDERLGDEIVDLLDRYLTR